MAIRRNSFFASWVWSGLCMRLGFEKEKTGSFETFGFSQLPIGLEL